MGRRCLNCKHNSRSGGGDENRPKNKNRAGPGYNSSSTHVVQFPCRGGNILSIRAYGRACPAFRRSGEIAVARRSSEGSSRDPAGESGAARARGAGWPLSGFTRADGRGNDCGHAGASGCSRGGGLAKDASPPIEWPRVPKRRCLSRQRGSGRHRRSMTGLASFVMVGTERMAAGHASHRPSGRDHTRTR